MCVLVLISLKYFDLSIRQAVHVCTGVDIAKICRLMNRIGCTGVDRTKICRHMNRSGCTFVYWC